jgi:WD40 repeat protein
MPASPFLATLLATQLALAGTAPAPTDRHGDPLPAGARARLGTVRFRHAGPAQFLAFSPGGKVLASGTGDGTLRLWEAASGKQLHQVPFTLLGPSSAAFSMDGKVLAVMGPDNRVHVWDPAARKELRAWALPPAGWTAVALSPDLKTAALLGQDQSLRLWDLGPARRARHLLGTPPKGNAKQPAMLRELAFSPDGRTLAAGGTRGGTVFVRLWDVPTGRELPAVTGPAGGVSALAFSTDGKLLAVGGGQELCLYDRATGKEVRRVPAARAGASSSAFAPGGKLLAVGNGPNVDLLEPDTGRVVRRLPAHPGTSPCVAFAPDGETLAVAGGDHTVRLWEVATGRQVVPTGGHRGMIGAVVCSPDGKIVATSAADRTIRLWEAATGKELRRLSRPGPALLAFTGGGKALAAAWPDGTVCLWDVASGKELRRERLPARAFQTAVFSADGNVLVAARPGDGVRLWDVATRREIRRLGKARAPGQPAPAFSAIALAPDGRTVAVARGSPVNLGFTGDVVNLGQAGGSAVGLWEVATGKERGQVRLPGGNNGGFNPYGSTLVTGSGTVYWSNGWGSPVSKLVFSPDGRTLFAARSAGHLWDLAAGRELRRLDGWQGFGGGAAFSPDGKLLALGGYGSFALWDVATGAKLGQVGGHEGSVTAVVFSADGKMLFTGGADTTVLVWDVGRVVEAARRRRADPSVKRLEALWQDLGGADGARAYRAVWALAAAPGRAVPFLAERLRPFPPLDAGRIDRLVAALGHARYAVRAQAVRELERLGEVAEPALRRALAGNPSLEQRRRVERLLDKAAAPVTSPEQLRALRAVEVLERAGTPEARRVLAALAVGAADARLTREARAALGRLAGRPPGTPGRGP